MQLLWSNDQEKLSLPENLEQLLLKVGDSVAKRLELPAHGEVSIAFIDDEAISELNLNYRGKAGPTDVLSFALEEGDEFVTPPDAPLMLGDIIISAERAKAQADEYGHTLEREIVFLLVHGLLHLAGFDHDDDNEGSMGALNEEIVRELGYLR